MVHRFTIITNYTHFEIFKFGVTPLYDIYFFHYLRNTSMKCVTKLRYLPIGTVTKMTEIGVNILRLLVTTLTGKEIERLNNKIN